MSSSVLAKIRSWSPIALLVGIGFGVYFNSLGAPFVFDDGYAIVDETSIRRPFAVWLEILRQGRSLVTFSLALNYALGGLAVRGYHVFNIAVHVLAGLTLYGLVRRTLLLPSYQKRFGRDAPGLALASALLWLVHPLQTESVTYTIQRAEALMGLFYLLTLYCLLRGAVGKSRRWYVACVLTCLFGMASKEVMITAPVVALLYDRAFLAGTWVEVFRRRKLHYLALATTMVLPILPFLWKPAGGAGFGLKEVTPLEYAASQPGVIAYYLRLSVWPQPLCLDYAWPVAKTPLEIIPPALLIGVLVLTAVGAWFRWPALGFLGLSFFLILAPTSSILPLLDLAVEHRMYLSLAAEIVLAVLAGYTLLQFLVRRSVIEPTSQRVIALGLVAVPALAFMALTVRRNMDYRSEAAIWSDVVAQRPDNPRAQNNLGKALLDEGRVDEAIRHCQRAVELRPDYVVAYNNLGLALVKQNDRKGAEAEYRAALRIDPRYAFTHNNLGLLLAEEGRDDEAAREYAEALRLRPDYVEAHNNRGVLLEKLGKPAEAVQEYLRAVQLDPGRADTYYNLGLAFGRQGKLAEAVHYLTVAVRLRPDNAMTHNNLGLTLARQGKLCEAVAEYEEALRLQPDYALAHNNLGHALEQQGLVDEAIQHFRAALRIKPDLAVARDNLARATAKRSGQAGP